MKDPFHYFDLEIKQTAAAKLEMRADERERKTEGKMKYRRRKAWPRAMESCNKCYMGSRRIKKHVGVVTELRLG